MMRHEGLNDYALLILRHALRRVINRLVETVARKSAFARKAIKVIFRSQGCDHAWEHCGVMRDDKLLTQTAFQSEAGNAERPVLIVKMQVARVVSRFRDSPGNIALVAVLDLSRDHSAISFAEKRVWKIAHDEKRHEVFEHRCGPRDQRAASVNRRELATQTKPVLLRHVAFSDCDKACQARFR